MSRRVLARSFLDVSVQVQKTNAAISEADAIIFGALCYLVPPSCDPRGPFWQLEGILGAAERKASGPESDGYRCCVDLNSETFRHFRVTLAYFSCSFCLFSVCICFLL